MADPFAQLYAAQYTIYAFNKDNIENITLVKQIDGMYLAYMSVKHDVTFRSFPKILN